MKKIILGVLAAALSLGAALSAHAQQVPGVGQGPYIYASDPQGKRRLVDLSRFWNLAVDGGADPLGVQDVTDHVVTAMQRGGNIYIPDGNYLIKYKAPVSPATSAGGAYATITKDLYVECSANARFFTDTLNGVDADMIRLSVPVDGAGLPAQKIKVSWRGCTFDETQQPGSTSMPFGAGTARPWDFTKAYVIGDVVTLSGNKYTATANNTGSTPPSANWTQNTPFYAPPKQGFSATTGALSIRCNYVSSGTDYNGCSNLEVGYVNFYSGAHWQIAGGDQALFFNGVDLANIHDNLFTGSRDAGVYSSGSPQGTAYGFISITHNKFVNCFSGAAVKRSVHGFEIRANRFENTVLGAYTNVVVGSGDKDGVIADNTFDRMQVEVRVDLGDGLTIVGNHGRNFGAKLADGVTKVTAYSPTAYQISGMTHSVMSNNTTFGVDTSYAASNPLAFTIQEFAPGTWASTTSYVFNQMVAYLGSVYLALDSSTNSIPQHDNSNPKWQLVQDGNFQSRYNVIANNQSIGYHGIGIEKDASDYNVLDGNYEFTGAVTNMQVIGAHTSEKRHDYALGRDVYMTPLLFDDGSAAAPMVARRGQQTTGLFFGTNLIGAATSGVERWHVDSTGVTVAGKYFGSVGTCAAPEYTFTNQTDLGIYRKGTNKLGFCSGTVEGGYFDNTNGWNMIPKTSATPIDNGDLVWQKTGDTTLTVKVKGSDGIVRKLDFTLAP